jgi:hypothetical protein
MGPPVSVEQPVCFPFSICKLGKSPEERKEDKKATKFPFGQLFPSDLWFLMPKFQAWDLFRRCQMTSKMILRTVLSGSCS